MAKTCLKKQTKKGKKAKVASIFLFITTKDCEVKKTINEATNKRKKKPQTRVS